MRIALDLLAATETLGHALLPWGAPRTTKQTQAPRHQMATAAAAPQQTHTPSASPTERCPSG